MIEGTGTSEGSRRDMVRRGLALSGSLFLAALMVWFSTGSIGASSASAAPPQPTIFPPTSPTTDPPEETTTTPPTTARPTTTRPPATTPTTEAPPPPEEEDPPPDEEPEPEPEEEDEEPVEEEVVETVPDPGAGPITTTINLLRQGNGQPGSEVAQAPPPEEEVEASGASDEDRVIWMIIVGLAAVALLVGLLTWRYWLLTRPGLDLSDDDPDDDGPDGGGGGGGFYGGPSAPPDPYAASGARRSPDVNPMTTGMPPAPSSGWQDPAPRPGPRQPDRPPRNDPFPAQEAPQRGRGGRGRRGGGDPFWDDGGEPPAPGRGEPGPPRRRQDPRSVRETDAWGRNPND